MENEEFEIEFSDLDQSQNNQLTSSRIQQDLYEDDLGAEMNEIWKNYKVSNDEELKIFTKFENNVRELNEIMVQDRINNPEPIIVLPQTDFKLSNSISSNPEQNLSSSNHEITEKEMKDFIWKSDDKIDEKLLEEIKRLEAKEEKFRQDYETTLMMKEDQLSMKYERIIQESLLNRLNEEIEFNQKEFINCIQRIEEQEEYIEISPINSPQKPIENNLAQENIVPIAIDYLTKIAMKIKEKRSNEVMKPSTEYSFNLLIKSNIVSEIPSKPKPKIIESTPPLNLESSLKRDFNVIAEVFKEFFVYHKENIDLLNSPSNVELYKFPFLCCSSLNDADFTDPLKLNRSQFIEIKYENLEKIPDFMREMKELKLINLSMNKFGTFDNFDQFRNMEHLNLSQNKIMRIPDISSFPKLKTLNLQLNLIDILPPLTSKTLISLDCSNNKIKEMSDFKGTPLLRNLILFRNEISEIRGLDSLKNLEELDIGRNFIKELNGIENCISLRKIILYYNRILVLPGKMIFPFLIELWLNGNRISSLPSIFILPSLDILNLEDNLLVKAEGLIFTPSLSILYMNFNWIESIESLKSFLKISSKLRKVSFYENEGIREKDFSFEDMEELAFAEEVNGRDFFSTVHCLESINTQGSSYLKKIILISQWLQNEAKTMKIIEKYPKLNSFSYSREFQQIRAKFNNQQMSLIKVAIDGNQELNLISLNDKRNEYTRQMMFAIRKIYCFAKRIMTNKKIKERFINRRNNAIIKIQSFFRGVADRIRIKQIRKIKQFYYLSKFATKIQKVLRGWIVRSKKKRLFSRIKYDIEDLEEFNDSFFTKELNLNYELKIPEKVKINRFQDETKFQLNHEKPLDTNFLKGNEAKQFGNFKGSNQDWKPEIRSKKFGKEDDYEMARIENVSNQSDRLPSIHSNQNSQILNKISPPSTSSSVFLPPIDKSHNSGKKTKEKEKFDELINEWGLKQDETKDALWLKFCREKKRKDLHKIKTLTASERYQKFLKDSKK